MTWTPRKPVEVNVPDKWPFPRAIAVCTQKHCPILSCCQQSGKCLGTDAKPLADVEDALL